MVDAPSLEEIEQLYLLAYEGNQVISEFEENPDLTERYIDEFRAINGYTTPFAEIQANLKETYSEWDREYGSPFVGSEEPQTVIEVVNNKRAEGIDFLWQHGFKNPTDLESDLGWLDNYLQSLYNMQNEDGVLQGDRYEDMEEAKDLSKDVMEFFLDIQELFEDDGMFKF